MQTFNNFRDTVNNVVTQNLPTPSAALQPLKEEKEETAEGSYADDKSGTLDRVTPVTSK